MADLIRFDPVPIGSEGDHFRALGFLVLTDLQFILFLGSFFAMFLKKIQTWYRDT